jgi:hypothetical protein
MGPSEVWVGELEQATRALTNAVQSNELADEGRRKRGVIPSHRQIMVPTPLPPAHSSRTAFAQQELCQTEWGSDLAENHQIRFNSY